MSTGGAGGPGSGRRQTVHWFAVILMAILRAAGLGGVLMYVSLITGVGYLLVGLLVGATLGIFIEVMEERARAARGGKFTLALIRGLEGVPVGFLVGVVVFGNDQDWQQPTAMTTVAGVLVGIMLEAVQPKTVRGTALIVTRLVRALYKGGAGSVGGATLLVIPVLVSFGSGVPWVSVAPPAGGILGGVSAVIASFIVSLIAATVMLAIALIAGALLGALLGGIIGITLEFSTPHVSSKMGSAAALTDAGRGLH